MALSAPRLDGNPTAVPSIGSLRVLGVDPEKGFAGGETQVLGLTLELARMGHRVELACDQSGTLWQRASKNEIQCRALSIRNAIDVGAGMRLRQLLKTRRYDVVHFHTSRAHSLAPFARGLASALVVTRRMDYRPNRMFAPILYNRAVDGIAAISSGVADALAAAGVDRSRVRIIPSGVDCDRFRPPSPSERAAAREQFAIGHNTLAIGTVGMLEERKGHRYLLQAMALLRENRSELSLKCLIGGHGAEHETLAAMIQRMGISGEVRLLGKLADARSLLDALDIFVLPSIKEGMGVALLEAMACGLPCIASRVGGIVDVIEDGRTGILIPPADPEALAGAIALLAANSSLKAALGTAAHARAPEKFSMHEMARKTLEFYRAVLASGDSVGDHSA